MAKGNLSNVDSVGQGVHEYKINFRPGYRIYFGTHTDPAFIAEYRRLTSGDIPTPLMPDEQAKVVRDIPRDAETIELFKKFAGTSSLPPRQ